MKHKLFTQHKTHKRRFFKSLDTVKFAGAAQMQQFPFIFPITFMIPNLMYIIRSISIHKN